MPTVCTSSPRARSLGIGPIRAGPRLLPHVVPSAGMRLAAHGRVLAYIGDTGPRPEVVAIAAVSSMA